MLVCWFEMPFTGREMMYEPSRTWQRVCSVVEYVFVSDLREFKNFVEVCSAWAIAACRYQVVLPSIVSLM